MKLLNPLLLATATAALTVEPSLSPSSNLASNPDPSQPGAERIPTAYESAVLARRILALTPLGTISTVFPTSASSSAGDAAPQEKRPAGLGGAPIGLMEYIADCEPNGNPTVLAIQIATSFKNARAGSNVSLALDWKPPYPPSKRIGAAAASSWFGDWWWATAKDPLPYSAANLPRFSLQGYLEPIDESKADAVAECFVRAHPDARYWLPGNRIHASEWVRLVVTEVYWIGGFGDRAYIGWIPVEDFRSVTRDEWEAVRLPGEKKGWKEWAVGGSWWGGEDDL